MVCVAKAFTKWVGEVEPVSLIVNALISGAATALKDTASQALKDAYRSLKHLLTRGLEGSKGAQVALERFETKPDVWRRTLQDELVRTGAAQDEQIIQAAETLMTLLDPRGARMGKYNIQITGPAQGIVIGDHARVTQSFGSSSTEP
jgi:hypothetical protein